MYVFHNNKNRTSILLSSNIITDLRFLILRIINVSQISQNYTDFKSTDNSNERCSLHKKKGGQKNSSKLFYTKQKENNSGRRKFSLCFLCIVIPK